MLAASMPGTRDVFTAPYFAEICGRTVKVIANTVTVVFTRAVEITGDAFSESALFAQTGAVEGAIAIDGYSDCAVVWAKEIVDADISNATVELGVARSRFVRSVNASARIRVTKMF